MYIHYDVNEEIDKHPRGKIDVLRRNKHFRPGFQHVVYGFISF